ncbi:MAG: PD-(D/E)XK nuclease family protein [Bacteroidaceae bacterium]|nr:PD-(D/E)XK nuclease family protein [Bacteroidaceae bacterium]
MTPFLKIVAQDLYDRFGGELHNVAVVFPNKRASLFFNEYLMQISGKAMWSPVYITISELFEQSTQAAIGDPILLVSKLYKEYVRHTHSTESIDSFYSWGELLIKDFDDVDKNMAEADKLFANITDLYNIGTTDETLSKEQKEALGQFFVNFKPQKESKLKQRFLHIWEVMGKIYNSFKEQLRSEGIAYEGMLYRDAIESSNDIPLPHTTYAFVGFNLLSKVESKLFDKVQKSGKALFYWDYDNSYTNDGHHEAGRFMRRNLELFPNAIKNAGYNNIGDKKFEIVSADTNSIQMRYASQWIEKNIDTENEVETAVILCDETQLEAVYHIIPPVVKERNITMGFPVAHTPVFNLIKTLIKLQCEGYDATQGTFTLETVHDVLSHPYILTHCPKAAEVDKSVCNKRALFPTLQELQADELLTTIFTHHSSTLMWITSLGDIIQRIARSTPYKANISDEEKSEADIYNELFLEAQLKAFTQIQRLINLIEEDELTLSMRTLGNLLLRILSSTTIPFHGEPVVGMQIMGLLESRNLDFRNIIFLSANEGNLPKKSSENSFIPYNLRRAFGLTLSEYRDSIYAYNFYRLLQRAEKVTIVYNSNDSSSTGGECSRYIMQLMADGHCGEKIMLTSMQKQHKHIAVEIKKTPEMIEHLRNIYDCNRNRNARILSPSAINSYLACGARFFYRYIVGLQKFQEVTTEVQKNDFGKIFHKAMEIFYDELLGGKRGEVEENMLTPFIDNEEKLFHYIDKAFGEEFFENGTMPTVYNGEQFINREVLKCFMQYQLRMDANYTPFIYEGGEKTISFNMDIKESTGETVTLCIGGRTDRIDTKNGTLEIIDYKTSSEQEFPANLEAVFAHEGNHPHYIFQAMLYSVAALESGIAQKASPLLIYINKARGKRREDFVVHINKEKVEDASKLHEEFKTLLEYKLGELFDVNTPFSVTDDEERCLWCDFKNICERKGKKKF